jgi:hypothetical protein
MSAPPDPLASLRDAWTIALNPNAHRLLRHAIDRGKLALADALEVSQATTSRSAAENLATRLEDADLLMRTDEKRVTFIATPLGEAVGEFIAAQASAPPPALARPTILLIDQSDRERLEEAGFELATALRRAAVEVAALRHQPS